MLVKFAPLPVAKTNSLLCVARYASAASRCNGEGSQMAESIIVWVFRDYGAAHRAFYELLRTGIAPNSISIVAGERSNRRWIHRDFGILDDNIESYLSTVREGRTLLAVR